MQAKHQLHQSEADTCHHHNTPQDQHFSSLQPSLIRLGMLIYTNSEIFALFRSTRPPPLGRHVVLTHPRTTRHHIFSQPIRHCHLRAMASSERIALQQVADTYFQAKNNPTMLLGARVTTPTPKLVSLTSRDQF
ncbi:hypothetical protein Syun_017093 [Stephania yunnanensis]|uniref:Uncharacterized protein n=1 Tax=Stephania yunnanensis TaxID=152371 RepID=A0AAP0J8K3_9MAGN